jgi:hypothetical protein
VSRRGLSTAIAALLVLAAAGTASADGEAGVVIEYGDGRVATACVAFEGDSITGDELLERAERQVDQYSGFVCSIDGTGCQSSGSTGSCLCECQGAECIYWSYFYRDYGDTDWTYSALGFHGLEAGDGDVQGWRWGAGTTVSTAAPPLIAFEDICGHAPLGLATATVAATATGTALPPAPSPTLAPTLPASTGTPTLIETQVPTSAAPTGSPLPAGTVGAATATATVPATAPASSATAPAAGGSGGGSNSGAVVAFGVVGGTLVLAVVAAAVWRTRRGGVA